jgi:hypothetical protein
LAATLLWWRGIRFALHKRLASHEIPAYITRINSWVIALLAITTSRGVKNKGDLQIPDILAALCRFLIMLMLEGRAEVKETFHGEVCALSSLSRTHGAVPLLV